MVHKIFISHSNKEMAQYIASHFEDQGLICWYAPRDITPGMEWPNSITVAIDTAAIVIVLLDPKANDSIHVKNEVLIAVDKKRPILPVKIMDCELSDSLKYSLESLQSLNVTSRPPCPEDLAHIVQATQKLLAVYLPTLPGWATPPSVDGFVGRQSELEQLQRYIASDHCRLITLYGITGVGKSVLAAALVNKSKKIFQRVIWRSLLNPPPLRELLGEITPLITSHTFDKSHNNISKQIDCLVWALSQERNLIVLDNFEAVLISGKTYGRYHAGFSDYSTFLQRIVDNNRKSCILLTTSFWHPDLVRLDSTNGSSLLFELTGMSIDDGRILLESFGNFVGTQAEWTQLISFYKTPLFLRLVGSYILEAFAGNIKAFLESSHSLTNEIRDYLKKRLSDLPAQEQEIMTWLAIRRSPLTEVDIQYCLDHYINVSDLSSTLASLRNRSLIQYTPKGSTIHPALMTHFTEMLVDIISMEILQGKIDALRKYPLCMATAESYVRNAQRRMILSPVLVSLIRTAGGRTSLYNRLSSYLEQLRRRPKHETGYAAGNILNLLAESGASMSGKDFSGLLVRQVDLQRRNLQGINFSNSTLLDARIFQSMSDVLSVSMHVNSRIIASGHSDGDVFLWDIGTGSCIQRLQVHRQAVWSTAFSPTGDLASCDGSGQVLTWDLTRFSVRHRLRECDAWLSCLDWDPVPTSQVLAVGGETGVVLLWDAQSGILRSRLQCNETHLHSLRYSHSGSLLAAGRSDGCVNLWMPITGKLVAVLSKHESAIWSIAWAPGDKVLATGSEDGKVKLWDLSSLNDVKCIATLDGFRGGVSSILFFGGEKRLAVASHDSNITMWERTDSRNWDCVCALTGHTGPVNSIASSGNIICSGASDQSIRVWDGRVGHELQTYKGYTNWVNRVLFLGEHNIVTGSDDGIVRIWNYLTGKCDRELELGSASGQVLSLAADTRNSLLASGHLDGTIHLWKTNSWEYDRALRSASGNINGLSYRSDDGLKLANTSSGGLIRVWDLPSNQVTFESSAQGGRVGVVEFSPNGSLLAFSGAENTIEIWDITSPHLLLQLVGHTSWIHALAFSPSGDLLASGAGDRFIKIWRTLTGDCIATLDGHLGQVTGVAFRPPYGDLLGTVSTDHTLKLWCTKKWRCLRTIKAHEHWIHSLAFRADGQLIGTCGADEFVKLWDPSTGECRFSIAQTKPYDGMNISNINLRPGEIETLRKLGAFTDSHNSKLDKI